MKTTLELSKMRNITSFNQDSGVLNFEPGLTQDDLDNYLKANADEYFAPHIVSGSVLENALEVNSILSVRGISEDGKNYESSTTSLEQFPEIFISQVSIKLQKKAPLRDVLVIPLESGELSAFEHRSKDLLQKGNVQIGSIKILNSYDWFATVVIYSHPKSREEKLQLVKDHYKNFKNYVVNEKKVLRLKNFLKFMPGSKAKKFSQQLDDMLETSTSQLAWFSPFNQTTNSAEMKLLEVMKKLGPQQIGRAKSIPLDIGHW